MNLPLPHDRVRNRAAWISALVSTLVFLLKIAAYRYTGSTAVLSDALESIVNVLAAFVALFVVRFAAQPADQDHPYGHGKAEYFSSAFEGGMISFAGIMIIGESLRALFYHTQPRALEIGLVIVGGATLINLLLGLYLRSVGRKYQSESLSASGTHVLTDVYTTVGVIVGLLLVYFTNIYWIDPVVAIIVGLGLAYSGFKIVRQSMGGLLDQQDTSALQKLADSLEKCRRPGIIDIHHLRAIRSGRFHHVDAHLVVPEYWDIAHVHDVEQEFETAVVKDYDFDGELALHLDPCKKSYCRICDVENCPIRQEEFQGLRPFTLKSLTEGPRPTNH